MEKKYYPLLLILLCLMIFIGFQKVGAQNLPDSVQVKLESAKSPTAKCEVFQNYYQSDEVAFDDPVFDHLLEFGTSNRLYECLLNVWKDRAIKAYNAQKLSLAKDAFLKVADYAGLINDSVKVAVNLTNAAYMYTFLGEQDSAFYFYNTGIKMLESIGAEKYLPNPYLNLATLYSNTGLYDEAFEQLFKALRLYRTLEDVQGESYALNNLGFNYHILKDFEQSRKYYKEAYELKVRQGNMRDIGRALFNLSGTFDAKKQRDSTEYYLNEALKICLQERDTLASADVYSNLGLIAKSYKEYDKALAYLQKSYDIRVKYEDKMEIAKSLTRLTQLYAVMGNLSAAKSTGEEAIEMNKNSGYLNYLADTYNALGRIHLINGLVEAGNNYLELYEYYRDSLFSQQTASAAAVSKVRMGLMDREQELALREMQLSYMESVRKREWFIYILSIVFLGALIFLIWKRNQYKEAILGRENDLKQKTIDNIRKEHEIELLNNILAAQEEERMRIGKDLHDSLGSMLASVKVHMQAAAREYTAFKEAPIFSKTKKLLDEAHEELRRTSHNMMPEALNRLGLSFALTDLADFSSNPDTSVEADVESFEGEPIKKQAISIYRITQELVQNALKHAQATKIRIQLQNLNTGELILKVSDNGCGMDLEHDSRENGIGINSVRSRVSYLQGTMDIQSTKDEGTTITITCPLVTTNPVPSDEISQV